MPLSRLSAGIARKIAILGTSTRDHSEDRLINPTASLLGCDPRLFRTARSGWRDQTRKNTYSEDSAFRQFYLFISK